MTFIVTSVVGTTTAGILGGAVLTSGVIGAVGSGVAANEQAKGAEAAANTQSQMFNTITGNESPYMTAGNNAEATLSQLLGTSGQAGSTVSGTNLPVGYLTQTFNPTMQQLENYPGYEFALQQGDNAVRNADTPGSGALSGAALKDLMSFNQNLASTTYGNAFNQFQTQQNNIFNRLSTIASLGQNAAGTLGNNGAQLGTGIAQAQAAGANATAGGIVGATNAIASTPMNYMFSQYLNNNSGINNNGSTALLTPAQTPATNSFNNPIGLGSGS